MAKMHPADVEANDYFERQKRFSGKAEELILTVSVCAAALLLLVLFFLLPKKEYSKTENKTLASMPVFSLENLGNGRFTAGTVSYIKDRFPLRETCMELNALYDLSMLRLGSNGVALGKDGYLLYFEHDANNDEQMALKTNARVISILSRELPTVIAAAGKGSEVLLEKYPAALSTEPAERNAGLVREALSGAGGEFLDLIPVLRAHGEEEIYFRTDHHWTALGAYYAAGAILEKLGARIAPLDSFRKEVVLGDFKGTLYNRSGMYFHEGEELFLMRCEGDEGYTVREIDLVDDGERPGRSLEKEMKVRDSLYQRECLEEDYHGTAYDVFVTTVGVPVLRIEKKTAEGETREKLLVVKDSFAHSVLPYLAAYYDIVCVDFRSNSDYALQLIEEGQVDRALILVNSETLFS